MKSMSCAYKNGNLISVSQSPPRNKFFAPPYLPPLSAPPLLCPPAMKMQYLGNPAKGKTEKQILNISLNLRFGKCNMSQILFRYYSQANLIYKFNETTIIVSIQVYFCISFDMSTIKLFNSVCGKNMNTDFLLRN